MWCVKDGVRASPVPQVPRLPRKVTVDVTKCHACHVKRRWMSPSAAPATQNSRGVQPSTPAQARRQSPPSAICATPATQSRSRCHQVPRLLRKVEVDVTKCHARQPRCPAVSGPSAPPEPAQCHMCHACHAKWKSMSPSATPATQSGSRCHQVPRLPRETKVDVTECHACHAEQPRRTVCEDKLCDDK